MVVGGQSGRIIIKVQVKAGEKQVVEALLSLSPTSILPRYAITKSAFALDHNKTNSLTATPSAVEGHLGRAQ